MATEDRTGYLHVDDARDSLLGVVARRYKISKDDLCSQMLRLLIDHISVQNRCWPLFNDKSSAIIGKPTNRITARLAERHWSQLHDWQESTVKAKVDRNRLLQALIMLLSKHGPAAFDMKLMRLKGKKAKEMRTLQRGRVSFNGKQHMAGIGLSMVDNSRLRRAAAEHGQSVCAWVGEWLDRFNQDLETREDEVEGPRAMILERARGMARLTRGSGSAGLTLAYRDAKLEKFADICYDEGVPMGVAFRAMLHHYLGEPSEDDWMLEPPEKRTFYGPRKARPASGPATVGQPDGLAPLPDFAAVAEAVVYPPEEEVLALWAKVRACNGTLSAFATWLPAPLCAHYQRVVRQHLAAEAHAREIASREKVQS